MVRPSAPLPLWPSSARLQPSFERANAALWLGASTGALLAVVAGLFTGQPAVLALLVPLTCFWAIGLYIFAVPFWRSLHALEYRGWRTHVLLHAVLTSAAAWLPARAAQAPWLEWAAAAAGAAVGWVIWCVAYGVPRSAAKKRPSHRNGAAYLHVRLSCAGLHLEIELGRRRGRAPPSLRHELSTA